MPRASILVTVPVHLKHTLKELAADDNRAMSHVVIDAIEQYLLDTYADPLTSDSERAIIKDYINSKPLQYGVKNPKKLD